MSKTTFITAKQKAHLEVAKKLTGSEGFMEDARAVAAYKPGHPGEASEIQAIFVFEAFRGGRAELHFGMAHRKPLTAELVQTVIYLAFNPEIFNLDRLLCRVPVTNPRAICALLKIGFQIEYRDRASVARDEDAIVLSLDRDKILKASAGPQTDEPPEDGE